MHTTATVPSPARIITVGRTQYEVRRGLTGYPIIWRVHPDGRRTTPNLKTQLRVAREATGQGVLT